MRRRAKTSRSGKVTHFNPLIGPRLNAAGAKTLQEYILRHDLPPQALANQLLPLSLPKRAQLLEKLTATIRQLRYHLRKQGQILSRYPSNPRLQTQAQQELFKRVYQEPNLTDRQIHRLIPEITNAQIQQARRKARTQRNADIRAEAVLHGKTPYRGKPFSRRNPATGEPLTKSDRIRREFVKNPSTGLTEMADQDRRRHLKIPTINEIKRRMNQNGYNIPALPKGRRPARKKSTTTLRIVRDN